MLEIWRMWATLSLPLTPGPLWHRVVAPNRVLSMGQIEQTLYANKWLLFNCDCYIAILEINKMFAQSAGAVEYTDCPSAEAVRPPPNECLEYDTKQSDGEVPAVLELWGMRSTPSLPSLPGPLSPGVVAPDRALSMGWIELTAYLHLNCVLMLDWIIWNGTVFRH